MSSKINFIFLLALLSFSIFSIGNNFNVSSQEISSAQNFENKISKSYSVVMFDGISISDHKNEKFSLSQGKSYSVFISDNLNVSDNSEKFDMIVLIKYQSDMLANLERLLISDKNKFSLNNKMNQLLVEDNFIDYSNNMPTDYIFENIFGILLPGDTPLVWQLIRDYKVLPSDRLFLQAARYNQKTSLQPTRRFSWLHYIFEFHHKQPDRPP